MPIQAEQDQQLVEIQGREWPLLSAGGLSRSRWADVSTSRRFISLINDPKQTYKPKVSGFQRLAVENGIQEQKSAKWRLESKSKNPFAGRTPKAKPE